MSIEKYLKSNPSFLCPGCTHGTVTNAFLHAVDKMGWNKNNTVIVCAIGCAGRVPTFLDFNVLRVTHGRALAFATGLKLARPDLNVVVFMGDGDAAAIGGNHLIHASRRNIDITAFISHNEIYGMTGGQYAPTTPMGCKATTAPYGMLEPAFDVCELVKGAGATFVARGDVYHITQLQSITEHALKHKGFSVVEVITSCPSHFGRRNDIKTPVKMVERIRDMTVTQKQAESMSAEELADKLVIGEFVNRADRPELTETYDKLLREQTGK